MCHSWFSGQKVYSTFFFPERVLNLTLSLLPSQRGCNFQYIFRSKSIFYNLLLEREWGGGDLKFISFWSSTSRVLCHTEKTALNMDKALFEFDLRKGGQAGGGGGR